MTSGDLSCWIWKSDLFAMVLLLMAEMPIFSSLMYVLNIVAILYVHNAMKILRHQIWRPREKEISEKSNSRKDEAFEQVGSLAVAA